MADEKKRLPSYNYKQMGLIGKTLFFAPDPHHQITCQPISSRKVLFRGYEISQMEAARRATEELKLPARKNGLPREYYEGNLWETEDSEPLATVWGRTCDRVYGKNPQS